MLEPKKTVRGLVHHLSKYSPYVLYRVTRGKTPRFQHNNIFSQKLSEIFQLCKVHVFTKLLGHNLSFENIIFHIWEFSYPNICLRKKKRLAPCLGQDANPCGAIGITKFADMKNNFKKYLNVPQDSGKYVNFTKIEKSLIVFEKKNYYAATKLKKHQKVL